MSRRSQRGASLLETLVGLFLIGLGVLGVAPMFMVAMEGNDAGGDIGQVSALAVDRMEQLRETPYTDTALTVGGDLNANVAAGGINYFDASNPGYVIRWRVEANATPPKTKIVTVRAITLSQQLGPQRVATLTSMRGE